MNVNDSLNTSHCSGGKHNIGERLVLKNPSLRWMAHEAASSGLMINLDELREPHTEPETVRKTLKGLWWILEYLPIEHRSYKDRDSVTHVYV